ncbi:biotin/lipoyl-binding protein [Balneolales bacterium ANBcel1]|nr:biotin/lipoyl-binding protein [Balneolales bacterium ANBcel1]
MKRKKVVIASLALIFGLSAASLALMASRQKEFNRQDLLEGRVKLETVYIASKVPGRISEVRVEEGDMVRAGDTLAIIDVPEIAAKLDQAGGAVASARAQYEMARAGATTYDRRRADAQLDAARAQYEFAAASYRRMENMFNDSLIAAQEYEKIRAQYRSARSQLEAARAQKEDADSGVRSEKIEMARGDLQRAQAALREAEIAWQDRVITAPADLRVQDVVLRSGELATPGYNLFSGYVTEAPKFRFTVPESMMEGFQTGSTYMVSGGFDHRELEVTLQRIAPLPKYASITTMYPRHQLGESVYELHFRPVRPEEAAALQHNMTFLIEP